MSLGLFFAGSGYGMNFSVEKWRWKAPTSLDSTSVAQGDAARITWSVVPDGAYINDYEFSAVNDLNAFLANDIGPGAIAIIETVFARLGSVCGLQCERTADTGIDVGLSAGKLGQRGDIYLCGSGNMLDYAAWADMPRPGGSSVVRVNTGLTTWTPYGLQQVVMHETGHAIGLAHQTIYAGPEATTEFRTPGGEYGSIVGFLNGTGPQFDDVYALHRLYGDVWERNGGNDTPATATGLGVLTNETPKSLGTQINGLVIAPNETDFLSIDGTSDKDCFRFSLTKPGWVTVTVTPKGPIYDFQPEGGIRVTFEAAKQSALAMELLGAAGQMLGQVAASLPGEPRTLSMLLGTGTYVIRVGGAQDSNQFYRLDLSSAAVTQAPLPAVDLTLAGQVASIGIAAVPGLRYRVFHSDTLLSNDWVELAPGWIDATSARITVTDALVASRPQRFYRVEVGVSP